MPVTRQAGFFWLLGGRTGGRCLSDFRVEAVDGSSRTTDCIDVGLACLWSVDAVNGSHSKFHLKGSYFQTSFKIPVLLAGHGVGVFRWGHRTGRLYAVYIRRNPGGYRGRYGWNSGCPRRFRGGESCNRRGQNFERGGFGDRGGHNSKGFGEGGRVFCSPGRAGAGEIGSDPQNGQEDASEYTESQVDGHTTVYSSTSST